MDESTIPRQVGEPIPEWALPSRLSIDRSLDIDRPLDIDSPLGPDLRDGGTNFSMYTFGFTASGARSSG
ncbi:hypothetical protein C9I57_10330 [Trinickia symbiotica]|uniref:Uncharacterized protein n=1 Tax=Trinickia symbiotica TaxID=863227 RepID=A0A2T3XX51_9BURK|nr:hypothetical protein C9I57_10330 [Trinickia symbiotica]